MVFNRIFTCLMMSIDFKTTYLGTLLGPLRAYLVDIYLCTDMLTEHNVRLYSAC